MWDLSIGTRTIGYYKTLLDFALSSLGLKASLRKWFGAETPEEIKIPQSSARTSYRHQRRRKGVEGRSSFRNPLSERGL